MINITQPIAEITSAVLSRQVSVEELVVQSLSEISRREDLHAILEINPRAVEEAKKLDQAISQGRKGKLIGVPFIAKDNFLTLHTHTTASSNILRPFVAPYQATSINLLEQEGAIMVAKANMDAFAHGSSTENSDFGATKNPWDTSRVPGGSSGGCAAAVASGLATFAVGTDTGGSIRQPASFCGIVGLKPTYGLVSRYGVIAMASSTDVIGPITRSVEDASKVLDVIAGQDPNDGTTIQRDPEYSMESLKSLRGLKVGVISEYFSTGLDDGVRQRTDNVIEVIKSLGADTELVSLPAVDLALACYYIIVPAEISSNLARYDGIKFGYSDTSARNLAETYDLSRNNGFGAEAKRRILIGTYVLSSGYYDAYYKQAQKVRTLLIEQFEKAFKEYDILVGPTTPTTAFKLGENTQDPLSMYLSDVMTVAANLIGIPAISIPSGISEGLPVGFQLMAAQRQENSLLSVAHILEQSLAKNKVAI
ncbi:MAG: Asp-tRNA(Asn)/Glu-tRNA(Gln) amidotransferase subunit GatA [Candidatus Saccharimonadia bacterium]